MSMSYRINKCLLNLVHVLNNSASLGGTFVSQSGGAGAGLGFTASAGTTGNDFSFQSGSTQVTATGGTEATVAGGVLMGIIFPSKNENASVGLSTSAMVPASGHIISSSFFLTLNGTGWSGKSFSASLNPNNEDYLFWGFLTT